jgi:hypothetical protein
MHTWAKRLGGISNGTEGIEHEPLGQRELGARRLGTQRPTDHALPTKTPFLFENM